MKLKNLPLQIELVPSTCAGKNLRKKYPEEWPILSRFVRYSAHGVCSCCGEYVEDISNLDAHEVWEYKKIKENGKTKRIQRLVDIVPLCTKCHLVKHIGFAASQENLYNDAVNHFLLVNDCSYALFRKAERKAFEKCAKRSKHKWKMITTLEQAWKIVGVENAD